MGKGGKDVYNMVGITYFKRSDTDILADAIEEASSDPRNDILFWDDVVDQNLDRLNLTVHKVGADQIAEIDTVEELVVFDKNYVKYLEQSV